MTLPTNRTELLPRSRFFAVALLALVAVAGAFAAGNPPPPSGIIINHVFKVNTIGLTCDVCHSPSEKNPRLMAFPTMDTCSACHADDTDMSKGTDACVKCHSNADYSSKVRKDLVLMPAIAFDHAKHAAAKVDCLACHTIFDKVGVKGDEMLPKMATCVACHSAKQVSKGSDCATCHTDSNIGSEKPASHGALWLQNHGKALSQKTIDQSCNLCHTVQSGNDCASCHLREAPKNHNGAWTLQTHGQAATANRASCSTCHTENQCVDCHTSQKPFTHTGAWGSTGAAGEDRHCYSCHIDSGTYSAGNASGNCALCHASADIAAKHQSQHRIVTHTASTSCSACHTPSSTGTQRILHPYPASTTQCASCHIHD
jgi:hypothetical protein